MKNPEGTTRKDLINQVLTKAHTDPSWPLMKHPEITVGKIIRSFKAEATKKIHDAGFAQFAWLARFYEHVIRDGADLDRIREYIAENPANWIIDEDNPVR